MPRFLLALPFFRLGAARTIAARKDRLASVDGAARVALSRELLDRDEFVTRE